MFSTVKSNMPSWYADCQDHLAQAYRRAVPDFFSLLPTPPTEEKAKFLQKGEKKLVRVKIAPGRTQGAPVSSSEH